MATDGVIEMAGPLCGCTQCEEMPTATAVLTDFHFAELTMVVRCAIVGSLCEEVKRDDVFVRCARRAKHLGETGSGTEAPRERVYWFEAVANMCGVVWRRRRRTTDRVYARVRLC